MNRTFYRLLWVCEAVAIVGLVLALIVPIQDYALREYIAWRQHPSPETYQALLEKQRQGRAVRVWVAVPFGVAAILLTGPLRRHGRPGRG